MLHRKNSNNGSNVIHIGTLVLISASMSQILYCHLADDLFRQWSLDSLIPSPLQFDSLDACDVTPKWLPEQTLLQPWIERGRQPPISMATTLGSGSRTSGSPLLLFPLPFLPIDPRCRREVRARIDCPLLPTYAPESRWIQARSLHRGSGYAREGLERWRAFEIGSRWKVNHFKWELGWLSFWSVFPGKYMSGFDLKDMRTSSVLSKTVSPFLDRADLSLPGLCPIIQSAGSWCQKDSDANPRLVQAPKSNIFFRGACKPTFLHATFDNSCIKNCSSWFFCTHCSFIFVKTAVFQLQLIAFLKACLFLVSWF